MQIFAIRHKPTGKFIPSKMSRNGGSRGWSHWSPGIRDGFGDAPRIFDSEIKAKRALSAWLRGEYEVNDYDYGHYRNTLKQPKGQRNVEDMEIVVAEIG